MNTEAHLHPSQLGNRTVDFRLEVQMRLQYLTAVRRTVCDMAQAVVQDADLASRLALATHELLENALKYATDDSHPVTLKLWVDSNRHAQVTVSNVSTPEAYQRLREHLHKLHETADPVAHYHQMLAAAMHAVSGSGLGLARILAEAEMTLSCVMTGNQLAMVAEANLGDRP